MNDTQKEGHPVHTVCFELARDQEGLWHWCLWSGNGRAIAMNAVGFQRRNDCAHAIEVLQRILKDKVPTMVRTETNPKAPKVYKKKGTSDAQAQSQPIRQEPAPQVPDPAQAEETQEENYRGPA